MKTTSAHNFPDKANLNVYEKRFHLMMKLCRIGQMLKKAKIQHHSITK